MTAPDRGPVAGEPGGDWLDQFVTPSAHHPSPSPSEVRTLPAVPAPSSVYRKAVVETGRAAMMSTPEATTLPGVALHVADLRLDRERLDAYAHLVGERAGDTAPPGFVHISVFGMQLALMARTDFPLPMLGMVHIANRIEQVRAARVDEALEVTTHATNLLARPVGSAGTGTQVDLVTRVHDSAGELVWRGTSTYLAARTALAGLEVVQRPERPADATDLVPTGGWHTAKADTRAYAAVSGDRNPIHLHTLAAKAMGFRRTIAHGMDSAARALAALGPARGDRLAWDVQFAAPILVPARVAVRVERDATGSRTTVWRPKDGRVHLVSTTSA
ncbi:MaoC family dehydratase [Serinibacter salmoneus]|uniref:MaoC dehydratase-like protein n=1 Tax=Serinibacter salmoneus TaxID=556530 RepID=A0A2A9D4L3_9MICO|nr:MaoC/PaaZ C-terminal domain-containing protein [Serinibacter salmoneus]PFG20789.1 MaoC dehydratase-like protein [Serinibacter salmoneus]